jgi:hypothetical protein
MLHCIPCTIESKTVVFEYLKTLMNPRAVIFGSTLLQGDIPRRWLAQRLMNVYNSKGIFSNQHDTLEGLTRALDRRFRHASIEVVGCAALFSAYV